MQRLVQPPFTPLQLLTMMRNHLFNARKLMQQQLKLRFPEYAKLWKESR